eukprot:g17046.t1
MQTLLRKCKRCSANCRYISETHCLKRMFELSFKTKEGDAFQLEIEDAASSTVEELKIRLVSLDVTFEGCTLMFKGKICKDEKTLQDYG